MNSTKVIGDQFLKLFTIQRMEMLKLKDHCFKWAQKDSNLRPADYESAALTN